MNVGTETSERGARPNRAHTLLDGAAYNIAGYLNGDFEQVALEDAIAQINSAVWMLDQMQEMTPTAYSRA